MPFICSLCGIEIAVGEAMVPNIRMEVAHDRCVQKEISEKLPEAPSDVVISTTTLGKSIEVKTKTGGPGFGNPTASIEPCLPPTSTSVCAECGDRCISMCPACRTLVCQAFGWNGKFCGVAHEGKCAGARELREPNPKPLKPLALKLSPLYDTVEISAKSHNGKHKTKVQPKKRGRR